MIKLNNDFAFISFLKHSSVQIETVDLRESENHFTPARHFLRHPRTAFCRMKLIQRAIGDVDEDV